MRIVLSLLVGATIVTAQITPALAQTPSAEDIIKSLRPTGTISSGTRGIRAAAPTTTEAPAAVVTAPSYVAPAPAAAPAPAPRPVAAAAAPRPVAPPPPANAPSINLEVKFATNSADLTPEARSALDRLGAALSSADLAGFRFRIEGHTDTVGNPDANRNLSARRAASVVDYLSGSYHVDRTRLQAAGMGSDRLAVPTGPQVDEPRNRRVQVINLGT